MVNILSAIGAPPLGTVRSLNIIVLDGATATENLYRRIRRIKKCVSTVFLGDDSFQPQLYKFSRLVTTFKLTKHEKERGKDLIIKSSFDIDKHLRSCKNTEEWNKVFTRVSDTHSIGDIMRNSLAKCEKIEDVSDVCDTLSFLDTHRSSYSDKGLLTEIGKRLYSNQFANTRFVKKSNVKPKKPTMSATALGFICKLSGCGTVKEVVERISYMRSRASIVDTAMLETYHASHGDENTISKSDRAVMSKLKHGFFRGLRSYIKQN
jgi:hypothetical protein